jgi:hypothetical protein
VCKANEDLKQFYDYYDWGDYYIGLLSDEDGKPLNYYYNEEYIGGNSYYKENTETYSWDKFRVLKSEKLETRFCFFEFEPGVFGSLIAVSREPPGEGLNR